MGQSFSWMQMMVLAYETLKLLSWCHSPVGTSSLTRGVKNRPFNWLNPSKWTFVHNITDCFHARTLEFPSPVTVLISHACYANVTECSFFHFLFSSNKYKNRTFAIFYRCLLHLIQQNCLLAFSSIPSRSFIASAAPGSLSSDSPVFSINIKARLCLTIGGGARAKVITP